EAHSAPRRLPRPPLRRMTHADTEITHAGSLMLTQRIALYAAAGIALLVLVALGVFALMPGGGSDAGDLSPLVIVDGERLDPPYEVTRNGADVLVNNVLAQSLAPVTNNSTVGSPAAGDDVFTIVEQAGQASDAAGSGDAGADAALALLA